MIATLVAPFLASLVVLVAGSAIGVLGRFLPPQVMAMDMAGRMHWVGQHALISFVWSAWPAAIAGAAAAGLIIWRGRLGWLECAVLGAVSSSAFAFVSGAPVTGHLMPIAFVGAVIGVVMWLVLMQARIVKE